MLTQEQSVEIGVLKRRGIGIRAIARELGISLVKVRRYLKDAERGARRRDNAQADEARCVQGVSAGADQGGTVEVDSGAVLHRELPERGYRGGVTSLKAFFAPPKPQGRTDPVVRFETGPAEQRQAGFTLVRLGRKPLLAVVATLGDRNATFLRFTTAEDTWTLLYGLRGAFGYFGGVQEAVLPDTLRAVMLEHDAYGAGTHRFNRQLLTLSQEYGFRPPLCPSCGLENRARVAVQRVTEGQLAGAGCGDAQEFGAGA